MKRLIVLFVILVLPFVFFTAMAAKKVSAPKRAKTAVKEKTAKLDQKLFTDPTKPIQVSPSSPIVTLKLRSNATTGYAWYLLAYDHDVIRPISRKYVAPTSQIAGAPGYSVWRFKVVPGAFKIPQVTQLTLQYLRPWVVPNGGHKLSFTIMVNQAGIKTKKSNADNK